MNYLKISQPHEIFQPTYIILQTAVPPMLRNWHNEAISVDVLDIKNFIKFTHLHTSAQTNMNISNV